MRTGWNMSVGRLNHEAPWSDINFVDTTFYFTRVVNKSQVN